MEKLGEIFSSLKRKRMWINLFFGFSAGLPLMIVFSVVKIWARREGVELSTIGMLSWLSIPYSLNFFAGPFLDRFTPFSFGRRKSWLLITQVGLIASIFSLSFFDPKTSMQGLVLCTLLVAIMGATQDVAIDAYKREILPDEEIGIGSSLYVYGYRVGMLVTSGGGLWLADPDTYNLTFQQVFRVISIIMVAGVVTTLIADEPQKEKGCPEKFVNAVVEPIQEFFTRRGLVAGLSTLAFIFFFKFGDSLSSNMLSPFYVDMGYSNKIIAEVTKGIGFFSSMAGLGIGSIAIYRFGSVPCLFVFGILQCISTSLFSILTMASIKGSWWGLALVVGFEDFSSGLGTTALVTFMATLANKKYTATQYALFASLAALGRTLFGGFTGYIVEVIGYANFFYLGSLLALPGLILIFVVNKLREPEITEQRDDSLNTTQVSPS